MIQEGSAKLEVETRDIVSKDMDVFYNPVMALNRSISILLLRALDVQGCNIGLPLAGSGVRGIRFLLELSPEQVASVTFNDRDASAIAAIKRALTLNGMRDREGVYVSERDANVFLRTSLGYDYIDIDPFGSPHPYLESAITRLSRGGILAITATDTGALCGTYPKACKRKYWSTPQRGPLMHELGLRILIRRAQLVGASHDKALVPIYSYSKDHYMRVFLRCTKSRKAVDDVLRLHGMHMCGSDREAGPLWLGDLWDPVLARTVDELAKQDTSLTDADRSFLNLIASEAEVSSVGIFDLSMLSSASGLSQVPKRERVIAELVKQGCRAVQTHVRPNSLRTDGDEAAVVDALKKATARESKQ